MKGGKTMYTRNFIDYGLEINEMQAENISKRNKYLLEKAVLKGNFALLVGYKNIDQYECGNKFVKEEGE